MIVVGALLAAESGLHESWLDTFASALIATVLYWLAHSYAELLGRRLRNCERLAARALVLALVHEWSLIKGAAIPLLALLLAALGGASQATAVAIALWSSAVALATFELIAGLRAGLSRGELVFNVSVGVAMGVAILSLKVILH